MLVNCVGYNSVWKSGLMTDEKDCSTTSSEVQEVSEDALIVQSGQIETAASWEARQIPKVYPDSTLMHDLVRELRDFDPAFITHFADTDIDLSQPRPLPELSLHTPEEAMLDHALQIDPEITEDHQAQLISFYITTHGDPLGKANDGLYIQTIIDNVIDIANGPSLISPQLKAVQLSERHGIEIASTNGDFELIAAGEVVANTKPTAWIIENYIEHDCISQLYGPPKSYKSFLALDWACSIAALFPWCRNKIKTPGLVVYIAGEGQNGLGRRIKAWCQHNGADPAHLKLVVSSKPAQISDQEFVKIIQDKTNSAIEEFDALPVLFVIDTLARNFGSGDENNTADMNTIVKHLDDIRRPYRASMLIVHHTGRSNTDRERGSSSLPGALDASFKLSIGKANTTVTLDPKFMKDEKVPDAMDFKIKILTLDDMTDDEGGASTSLVLEPMSGVSQARKVQFFKEHGFLSMGKRREWVGNLLYAVQKSSGGLSNNALAKEANVSGSTVGPVIRYLQDENMLSENNALTTKGEEALGKLLPEYRFRDLVSQK
jgi:hypothetical protein